MPAMQQRWGYGLPDQADNRVTPSAAPSTETRHHWLHHLRGDVIGGFAAAMLSIPVSMGYGLLAFSAPPGKVALSTCAILL